MSEEMPKYFIDWLDRYRKGFVDRRGMDEHSFELYMIFSVVQIARGDSDDPEHDQVTRVGRFILANPEKCIKEVMRRYEALEKVEDKKMKTKNEVIEELKEEQSSLDEKITRLANFLSVDHDNISKIQIRLMNAQFESMVNYSNCLRERIQDLKAAEGD